MERQKAAALLSENLKTIFAFCLARLYDRSEAEDLTHDIVCEVLASVHRLKDDEAFYGFLWRIAENTLKRYIRKKQPRFEEGSKAFVGAHWDTPESEYVKGEEIRILRRELSLLSGQYRDVVLGYYIHGRSCAEIASDLGLSVDRVKYRLVKTRKILKEGFDMVREFGEKSYAPAIFRMDFWGDTSKGYWEIFEGRKLPGNILLAAYDRPLSVQELSLKLGVSVVYLEDELDILLSHGFLCKAGERFQTNIVIFTDEYETAVASTLAPFYEKAAEELMQALDSQLSLLPQGMKAYSEARQKWCLIHLIMTQGLAEADRTSRQRFGDYPSLSNGGHGFLFGYDNDYLHHHFNGIYGHCENREKTAYFSVVNYRVIESCQHWKPEQWDRSLSAMFDAVLGNEADPDNQMLIRFIEDGVIVCRDGRLSANFPVFTKSEMQTLRQSLADSIDKVSRCILKVCDTAEKMLENFVPRALRNECEPLCFVHHSMDTIAEIVERMVDSGALMLPEQKEPLAVFGVKMQA